MFGIIVGLLVTALNMNAFNSVLENNNLQSAGRGRKGKTEQDRIESARRDYGRLNEVFEEQTGMDVIEYIRSQNESPSISSVGELLFGKYQPGTGQKGKPGSARLRTWNDVLDENPEAEIPETVSDLSQPVNPGLFRAAEIKPESVQADWRAFLAKRHNFPWEAYPKSRANSDSDSE